MHRYQHATRSHNHPLPVYHFFAGGCTVILLLFSVAFAYAQQTVGDHVPKQLSPAPHTAISKRLVATTTVKTQSLTPTSTPLKVTPAKVHPSWRPLIKRLKKDGFDIALLENFFSRLPVAQSPLPMARKMREMYYRKYLAKKKKKKASTQKGKTPAKPPIYSGVVVPKNITRAKHFLTRHKTALASMEKKYGVPKEIAVGLMLVETRLGAFLGKVKAFGNLASLASTTNVKQVLPHLKGYSFKGSRKTWLTKRITSKSNWAYKELTALIQYSHANDLDPINMPGSVYGAVGICQFMPSNIIHFGVDGDGDGKVNLFHVPDAIHSLANYLHKHGWKPNLQRKAQQKVLYRYNHSTTYANTILAVADAINE